MTRHLCAAELVGAWTAAGVVEVPRAAATATQPTATATAIQRDEGVLRRIDCSFLAQRAGGYETVSENVSGIVNRWFAGKSSCFSQIARKFVVIRSGTFRN